MRFRIQSAQPLLSKETRAAVERKLRLALGRHAAGVEQTQITLSPVLDGRASIRCRIRVRLRDGDVLTVEDAADDATGAAAQAAWRLGNRLERHRAALNDRDSGARRAVPGPGRSGPLPAAHGFTTRRQGRQGGFS